MKVLIVSSDYESQPHKTIVDNIIKHLPEYEFIISDELITVTFGIYDIVYFLNIMDVIKNIYPSHTSQIFMNDLKACTSIRSYRAIQEYPEELKKCLKFFRCISADNVVMLDDTTKCLTIEEAKNIRFFTTPHSADTTIFKETNPIDPKAKKLTVGFSGSFRADKKYHIFKEATKKIGSKIIVKTVGKVSEKVPFEQMNEFYNSIDVLVCCSKQEGGPTPPLEAALCGRCTISTNVGFMRAAFDNQIYIFDGTVKGLIESIEFFIRHREHVKILGQKAKQRILGPWSWEKLIENYRQMFDYCATSR